MRDFGNNVEQKISDLISVYEDRAAPKSLNIIVDEQF